MRANGACGCIKTSPWQAIRLYNLAGVQLKQDGGLPAYITQLADSTALYEAEIRQAWEAFKLNPTEDAANEFIDYLIKLSGTMWPDVMAVILGIGVEELTTDQQRVLQDALNEHHGYMRESLLPDIVRAGKDGRLDKLDYRTTVLYAGALWAFGSLATVMFDGLSIRDLADLFMFAGPNDEATCTGPRGCQSHANQIYTVAQILADDILPGRMRCYTNCRHFLLPIASPLRGAEKHLPGRHDQSTHNPHKGTAGREPWQMTMAELQVKYPKAGGTVDGRVVREHIPNQSSIDSSIDYPTVLEGIYDVPMSEFDLTGTHYSATGNERIAELAGQIKESGEISPLIVVIDAEPQPYILEGATRAEALYRLGAKSFPALVVVDEGSLYDRTAQAIENGEWVPPEVLNEYESLPFATKHLPGHHDQRLHTPHKYRGGAVYVNYIGVDAYRAKELFNVTYDDFQQMFWLPGVKEVTVNVTSEDDTYLHVHVWWGNEAYDNTTGEADRIFKIRDEGLICDNTELLINERDAGLGSILYANQIRTLKAAGYKKLTLYADSSIGRYAWARKGFDYEDMVMPYMATNKFRYWAENVMGLTEYDVGGWPTFVSAKDVADYDPGITVTGANIDNDDVPSDMRMHLGKAFMLDGGEEAGKHGSWDGVLILND